MTPGGGTIGGDHQGARAADLSREREREEQEHAVQTLRRLSGVEGVRARDAGAERWRAGAEKEKDLTEVLVPVPALGQTQLG